MSVETRSGKNKPGISDDKQDVFVSILQKLDTVSDDIHDLTRAISGLSQEIRSCKSVIKTDISKVVENSVHTLGETLTTCVNTLTKEVASVKNPAIPTQNMEAANNVQMIQIENETTRRRNNIKSWNNSLNSRKTEYWKHHRSKRIASIYKDWLDQETPFILAGPKKPNQPHFQPFW